MARPAVAVLATVSALLIAACGGDDHPAMPNPLASGATGASGASGADGPARAAKAPKRLQIVEWGDQSAVPLSDLGNAPPGEIAVSTTPEVDSSCKQGECRYAIEAPKGENDFVKSASAGTDPLTGEPSVDVTLTPAGINRFEKLTAAVAKAGDERVALILGDRVLRLAQVDASANPNGLDGQQGVQISAGLVDDPAAQALAADLAQ